MFSEKALRKCGRIVFSFGFFVLVVVNALNYKACGGLSGGFGRGLFDGKGYGIHNNRCFLSYRLIDNGILFYGFFDDRLGCCRNGIDLGLLDEFKKIGFVIYDFFNSRGGELGIEYDLLGKL